jgi:hypothetical protein
MAEKKLALATGPYTADSVPNARHLKKMLLESAERTKSQRKAKVQIWKWLLELWPKLATFACRTEARKIWFYTSRVFE